MLLCDACYFGCAIVNNMTVNVQREISQMQISTLFGMSVSKQNSQQFGSIDKSFSHIIYLHF